MNQISEFASRFNAVISLDEGLIVKIENRAFLLNQNLKRPVKNGLFYVGTYLGKTKRGKFFPSFSLLRLIAEKKANKIVVEKKTAWLFICGRDVFRQGIIKVMGSKRKGDYTLVLNKYGECLGFGRIMRNLDDVEGGGVVVKNISDIGDFLRREKQRN
jgi:ribosome biogenesis protein Nip4